MAHAISRRLRATLRISSARPPHQSRGLSRSLTLLLALGLVGAWGCAETIHAQRYPTLSERPLPLRRIAVAPFSVSMRTTPTGEVVTDVPAAAAALLSRHVAAALSADGYQVIPPREVQRLLLEGKAEVPQAYRSRRPGDPRPMAWLVRHHFGADALVMGEVTRFRDRVGDAYGARRSASVGFDVTLHAAPSADLVWTAAFNETQRPMLENVFNVSRYPGGGARWLSADELARWGARELVVSLAAVR